MSAAETEPPFHASHPHKHIQTLFNVTIQYSGTKEK